MIYCFVHYSYHSNYMKAPDDVALVSMHTFPWNVNENASCARGSIDQLFDSASMVMVMMLLLTMAVTVAVDDCCEHSHLKRIAVREERKKIVSKKP